MNSENNISSIVHHSTYPAPILQEKRSQGTACDKIVTAWRGDCFTMASGNCIRLFDAEKTIIQSKKKISAFAWSPTSLKLAIAYADSIQFRESRRVEKFPHTDSPQQVAWLNDEAVGRLSRESFTLYDSRIPGIAQELFFPEKDAGGFAFASQQELLFVDQKGSLQRRDLRHLDTPVKTIQVTHEAITHFQKHHDEVFASTQKGTLHLIKPSDKIKTFDLGSPIKCFAFLEESLVIGHSEGLLSQWDLDIKCTLNKTSLSEPISFITANTKQDKLAILLKNKLIFY